MSFGKQLNKLTRTILENTEISKAEVLLAANSIVDELQKVIKNLGEIRNEDMPAIVTKIKSEMGVEAANKFTSDVNTQIDTALDTIRSAKDSVDNAVLELSGESIPSSIEDEISGLDDMDDLDDTGDLEAELDTEESDDLEDIAPEPPLGRLRKESIERKENRISESRHVTLDKASPEPKFQKFQVTFRDKTSAIKQRSGAPSAQLKQELHIWAKKYNRENSNNPIVNIKGLNESRKNQPRKK